MSLKNSLEVAQRDSQHVLTSTHCFLFHIPVVVYLLRDQLLQYAKRPPIIRLLRHLLRVNDVLFVYIVSVPYVLVLFIVASLDTAEVRYARDWCDDIWLNDWSYLSSFL